MRPKNAPSQVFDKIEHESLAQSAVNQIEDLILSGVLRASDMLPGERELADQFSISRPKVREALKQLSDNGLIKIIPHEGVFVAEMAGDAMSPALVELFNRNPSAIRDNLEYRREQEGFASRLAAQRASERDRAELRSIIEAMASAESQQELQRMPDLDVSLHSTIAFAAHNRTLTHMMTALYSLNKSSLKVSWEEFFNVDRASETLFRQHQNIVDAICDGKPEQSELAAVEHIDFVAELVETAFKLRHRESLARKRYRRSEEEFAKK